ncbi:MULTISPECIES: AfsR/SARP family transcriptional regulator [Frankia]|nr:MULTISPECIES: AfsR/SARP family transcriptional regulator [Frankia]
MISARKVEIMLAVFLVRANHVVSLSQLTTELWGDDPPRRAIASMHVYVSNLRKILALPAETKNPIVTRHPGYLLQMEPDDLDLTLFERRVQEGKRHLAEGSYAQASRCLTAALGLWRGPALGDLKAGPIVSGFLGWLEETRLECIELSLDADLALGRHPELVRRLIALTNDHPLRETFHHRLMLALYRSGRQVEALQVYQTVRDIFHRDLGLEPSRPLRDLQQAILQADEGLDLHSRMPRACRGESRSGAVSEMARTVFSRDRRR